MIERNTQTTELQGIISRQTLAARNLMPQVALLLGYFALVLAILPEYQFAYSATELSMRGWDGVLTQSEAFWVPIIAGVICMVTVVTFHWCIKKLANFDNGRYVIWILLIVSLMTISQPILNLLSELRFGNSINPGNDARQSLQNQLLTAGFVVRSLFVLAAAFVAGLGTVGILESIKGIWMAIESGRNALAAAEIVHMIDRGKRGVKAVNDEVLAYNRNLVRQLALAVSDGLVGMSREIRIYLSQTNGILLNPDQWVSEVVKQFDEPTTPTDQKIAELVRARLKRHAIDMSVLPAEPADLSDAERADLHSYANWLLEQANYDTVYNSTILERGV